MAKKKSFFALGVVVLVVVIIIATTFVVRDLTKESRFNEEIALLNTYIEAKDYEKADTIINRTVSYKEYAILEESIKSYWKDALTIERTIDEATANEAIYGAIDGESLASDQGANFENITNTLSSEKKKLDDCIANYDKIYSEDAAMSYVEDKNLSDELIEVYRNNINTNIADEEDSSSIRKNYNVINKMIDTYLAELTFLKDTDGWKIEDNEIVFTDQTTKNKYFNILYKILD